ncbi:hypothetical protein WR25_04504 [Diploscapter pachys]|uniref:Uncharacterized protein n=1 Tax=Diploscapter pachys TaxID=2018661 RepID=A0A2A2LGA5_9BILA|nr:hypothetical protein WR25_04504 [Diploscapter pachys]
MSESGVVRDSKAATVSLSSKDSEVLTTFAQAQSGSTSVEMNTEKIFVMTSWAGCSLISALIVIGLAYLIVEYPITIPHI